MLICRYLWLLVGLIFSSAAFAQCAISVNTQQIACSADEALAITMAQYPHYGSSLRIRDPGGDIYRIGSWSDYWGSWNSFEDRYVGLPSCPDDMHYDSTGACVPDINCGSGEREWNGQCRPDCDAMQTVNSETGNCECSSMRKPIPSPSVSGPGATPETTCYGGCSYKLGDMALNLGGKEWFSDLGQPTGQTCSAGQGESEKPQPETKEPPCAPGEGVATSSSGKVLCVPKGTPNAPKPDVEKTVKKETYPDGSEKTTETTKTKDPSTGATDTKSTSTSTGGMAGPAGTTTTTETSTGDGKGTGKEPGQGDGDGDGDCEGDDCGGGEGFKGPEGDLYEKKDRTMRDALEDFSAAVSDSPVMVAARNWFSIGGMPASCGGLSVTVPYLDTTISADSIFCGEYGVLIMQIAGAVVLAAAAYAGFRIAIL